MWINIKLNNNNQKMQKFLRLQKANNLNKINGKLYLKSFFLCILSYWLFWFIIIRNNNYKKNIYTNINITYLIKNDFNIDIDACLYIKNKLNKREKPFDYENELSFLISLISCNISFSFIRFADGEENIMRGKDIIGIDNWHWTPKLQKLRDSLIESQAFV